MEEVLSFSLCPSIFPKFSNSSPLQFTSLRFPSAVSWLVVAVPFAHSADRPLIPSARIAGLAHPYPLVRLPGRRLKDVIPSFALISFHHSSPVPTALTDAGSTPASTSTSTRISRKLGTWVIASRWSQMKISKLGPERKLPFPLGVK